MTFYESFWGQVSIGVLLIFVPAWIIYKLGDNITAGMWIFVIGLCCILYWMHLLEKPPVDSFEIKSDEISMTGKLENKKLNINIKKE